MLTAIEFCEEISQKSVCLSGQMVECDWDIYIDMLSESYPAILKELNRWLEEGKIGSEGRGSHKVYVRKPETGDREV